MRWEIKLFANGVYILLNQYVGCDAFYHIF